MSGFICACIVKSYVLHMHVRVCNVRMRITPASPLHVAQSLVMVEHLVSEGNMIAVTFQVQRLLEVIM